MSGEVYNSKTCKHTSCTRPKCRSPGCVYKTPHSKLKYCLVHRNKHGEFHPMDGVSFSPSPSPSPSSSSSSFPWRQAPKTKPVYPKVGTKPSSSSSFPWRQAPKKKRVKPKVGTKPPSVPGPGPRTVALFSGVTKDPQSLALIAALRPLLRAAPRTASTLQTSLTSSPSFDPAVTFVTGAVGMRDKFFAPTLERLSREEGEEGGVWSSMSLAAFGDTYGGIFMQLILPYGSAVSLDRADDENFQDVGEGFPAEVPAEEEVAKGGEKRKQRKGGGEEGGGKNGDGKNGDGKRRKGSVRGHDGNAESKKPESKKLGKFKCDRCSYKCSGSIDLKRHKSNTHDIDVSWIKCDRCEYKSKTTGHLKRHRASVHDGAT